MEGADGVKREVRVRSTETIAEDRCVFYEAAQASVFLHSDEENRAWHKLHGKVNKESAASFQIGWDNVPTWNGEIDRFVRYLQISLNVGIIQEISNENGEDYNDLAPYILEHEFYEAWLSVRQGFAQTLTDSQRHELANRREFLLAEQAGKGEKLLRFLTACSPDRRKEFSDALEHARSRLNRHNLINATPIAQADQIKK